MKNSADQAGCYPPRPKQKHLTSERASKMAEFIIGEEFPSETNYMSESGNSSAQDG